MNNSHNRTSFTFFTISLSSQFNIIEYFTAKHKRHDVIDNICHSLIFKYATLTWRPHARPRALPRALLSLTNNNPFYLKQYCRQRVQWIFKSEQSILLSEQYNPTRKQYNSINPTNPSDRSAQRTTTIRSNVLNILTEQHWRFVQQSWVLLSDVQLLGGQTNWTIC